MAGAGALPLGEEAQRVWSSVVFLPWRL